MKRSTKFVLAAVAALAVAGAAVPVVAQQGQMRHGGMMGEGMMQGQGQMEGHSHGGGHGQMEGHGGGHGQMGGGMGMMGAAQSYAMTAFDTNKDGTLSPEEMAAGIKAELATYDTDANGTLSLDEFAAMHAAHTRPMTVRAFQMHDADGDAQVTEAEMVALADQMQAHAGQHGGEGSGHQHGMMGNN
jgi:Ca2+-binding EF-hand superfamily protein